MSQPSLRRFTALANGREIESPRLTAAWSPDWAAIRARRRLARIARRNPSGAQLCPC